MYQVVLTAESLTNQRLIVNQLATKQVNGPVIKQVNGPVIKQVNGLANEPANGPENELGSVEVTPNVIGECSTWYVAARNP